MNGKGFLSLPSTIISLTHFSTKESSFGQVVLPYSTFLMGQNIDGQHLVLAITLKTIERENFNGLLA